MPLRVLATKSFARWARKARIGDADLLRAVDELQRGLIDARLGGGLFKKRVARPGGGKSGGTRTIVAGNFRDRWVFLFGFSKNERDNIDEQELEALKRLAEALLKMSASTLDDAISAGQLQEVSDGQSPASQGNH